MLSVLLVILKVIGYILLSILGLILLIILLLLNVPLRYRAKIIKDDEFAANAVVSWLLHIVHVTVSYSDDLHYKVRVFGIPIINSDKTDKDDENDDDKPSGEDVSDIEQALAEDKKTVSAGADLGITEQLGQMEQSEESEATSEEHPAAVLSEETAQVLANLNSETSSKEQTQSSSEEIKEKPDESCAAEHSESRKREEKTEHNAEEHKEDNSEESDDDSDKKESIVEKIKNIYNKYVTDETKRLVKLSFRQIVKLLKHILPRRIRGDVSYGAEDPSTTGYVTAIAAALYGKFGKVFRFRPNFTEEELEAHVSVKGHIRVITLVFIALKVLLNKDFRYTLKLIKGTNESDESDDE